MLQIRRVVVHSLTRARAGCLLHRTVGYDDGGLRCFQIVVLQADGKDVDLGDSSQRLTRVETRMCGHGLDHGRFTRNRRLHAYTAYTEIDAPAFADLSIPGANQPQVVDLASSIDWGEKLLS